MPEIKKFMDLSIGQKFKAALFNGPLSEYIKIQAEQVSCCVQINAHLSTDSTQRVQVLPLTEVEVVENTTNG